MGIDTISPPEIGSSEFDPGLKINYEPPPAKTPMEQVERFVFSLDRETSLENIGAFENSLDPLVYDPTSSQRLQPSSVEIIQQVDYWVEEDKADFADFDIEQAVDYSKMLFGEMWEVLQQRGLFHPGMYKYPPEFGVLTGLTKQFFIYLTKEKDPQFNAQLLDKLSAEIGNGFFELLCRYDKDIFVNASYSLHMKNCYFIFLILLSVAENDAERKIVAKNILLHANKTHSPSNPRYGIIRGEQKPDVQRFADTGPIMSPNLLNEAVKLSLLALEDIDLPDDEYESLTESAIDMASPATMNSYFQVLSRKPEILIRKLMVELNSDELDERRQKATLSLLFRLELGQVGISEEGLDYLGQRFDLGEYNDPSNFAQRITADGKVGVFDTERNLEGFVQLETDDFERGDEDNEQAIRKEVMAVTAKMLFIPRPDETDEEKVQRVKILDDFKANYFDTYLGMFSERSDLRFNNLNLPEQGWVLQYLQGATEKEREQFFEFVSKFGEDGFFAFRSMEFDLLTGQQVLTLPERIGKDETQKLLATYRETYKLADEVANHIARMLQFQDNDLEVNLIRENILASAQGYLIAPDFSSKTIGMSQLDIVNHELGLVLSLPPTISGFIEGQFIVQRFLKDNLSEISAETKSEFLAPEVISRGLEKLYNNPDFNLRDYEGATTNSASSIEYLIREFSDFGLRTTADNPDRLLVYDVGAGEGRISIPIALLGHRVVGIDISEKMVGQVDDRISSVVTSIGKDQIDSKDPLATATEEAFTHMGIELSPENVDSVSENVSIHVGNFFDFGRDRFIEKFGERSPDVAIIMWHTLGFAGDRSGQIKVLEQIFDNLRPGGEIIIEMPDRNFGGYARAIRRFHQEHPEQPFGAIIDAPSKQASTPTEENENISSARYFPSDIEIISALEEAGFSFRKVDSFFVTRTSEAGQALLIKENLYVASKPLDPKRMQKLLAAVGVENQNDSQL